MRKKVFYQLNIFDFPTDIEIFWSEFKPEVEKLKKKGFNSICETWWRSRYYESVICSNHSRNKNGFNYEKEAEKAWKFIWNEKHIYLTKTN